MLRSETLQTASIAAALVAAGCLAWWIQLRPPLYVDPAPLGTVPGSIDVWESVDIPLGATVESMLRADFNLQRIYYHPVWGRIEVYLGYYGTERGGRPEHTPWACYPSAGWTITEDQKVWVDRERDLRANELVVEKAGEEHLVLFWYRSFRSTGLVNGLDQALDRIAGRLAADRSDGALVRISTPIPYGDPGVVRGRLVRFAAEFDRLLAERWPVESAQRPDHGSRPAGSSLGVGNSTDRHPFLVAETVP
jgi:EpsI family protein